MCAKNQAKEKITIQIKKCRTDCRKERSNFDYPLNQHGAKKQAFG